MNQVNESYIGFCPVGGQNGIVVTTNELSELSNFLKKEYLDEFIPIPNITRQEQLERINDTEHTDHDENVIYFERENGRHGWCCAYCGKTVQWG